MGNSERGSASTTNKWRQKLPDADTLRRLIESGMSKEEVAVRYDVTAEAVRQKAKLYGIELPRQRLSHAEYLPWHRIRSNHQADYLAKQLRRYSGREQGVALSATESRSLDTWLRFMDGANSHGVPLAVHYDRNDPDGFWLERRAPTDVGYVSAPVDPRRR